MLKFRGNSSATSLIGSDRQSHSVVAGCPENTWGNNSLVFPQTIVRRVGGERKERTASLLSVGSGISAFPSEIDAEIISFCED